MARRFSDHGPPYFSPTLPISNAFTTKCTLAHRHTPKTTNPTTPTTAPTAPIDPSAPSIARRLEPPIPAPTASTTGTPHANPHIAGFHARGSRESTQYAPASPITAAAKTRSPNTGVIEYPPTVRFALNHPIAEAIKTVPATQASANPGPSANLPRPNNTPNTPATATTASNPTINQEGFCPGAMYPTPAPAAINPSALTNTSALTTSVSTRIDPGTAGSDLDSARTNLLVPSTPPKQAQFIGRIAPPRQIRPFPLISVKPTPLPTDQRGCPFLRGPASGLRIQEPIVPQTQQISRETVLPFRRFLAAWAQDCLSLRSRGLDTPTRRTCSGLSLATGDPGSTVLERPTENRSMIEWKPAVSSARA